MSGDSEEKTPSVEPLWCATANVKREILFGEARILRKGTKHFRGGAKVYIADAYWGMLDNATVVGHHRSNGRYIKIDMPAARLENFRLELVYSPKVIELIERHYAGLGSMLDSYTKEYAEKLVAALPFFESRNTN